MTIEELKEKLRDCINGGPEEGHIIADHLLLEYIDDDEVREIFTNLPKWYS